jgi:PAS domain S-box-containing protein
MMLPDPTTREIPDELQARLAGLVVSLPDAVLCFDRSWHLTYANPEAMRISRFQPEQFNTLSFWDMYPEVVGTEMERRYRAAMDLRQADHFEFYYTPFDVWVDIYVLPTDEGFAAFYRDITPRKHAEIHEQVAARQIRQVFEATPDGIVIIDSNWRFAFANQLALQLVGRDDIIGQDIFELFPGNRQEPFNSAYRTTMATREPTEFEAFHTAPINTWFRVQARPFDNGIIIFFCDISDRKRAEVREQETARRLNQVLELTSDAVASLDRQWRYTFLNANAQKLIDPGKRLVGKNIWEEFPLAVGGPAWEIYQRSMNEGLPGHAEVYYPGPIDAWLAITSQPASDGIVVFFRDITRQRNHDEIVRQQLELLEAVQSVARLATFEFDLDDGAIAWGPGAFAIYGHPLEEITDLSAIEQILLPGHAQRFRAEIDACRTPGTVMLIEYAVSAPDGGTLWIETRGESFQAPGGGVRIRGVVIDVTKRHLSQQHLIASEARYRVLADLNPQAIWMGDAEGNITYANQGFLSYLGLTLEGLPGKGWLKAFAPSDRTRVLEVWMRSVETGVDYNIEARLCKADAEEYRYWHLRAAPVRDASGSILHWLGVGQDIHDLKTYTASLRAEQMETERRRAELETIYKTSPVGLALLDPVNFIFLNLNDREAEMLGAPKDQLLGHPLSQIAPPEKMPQLFDLMRSAASGHPVRDVLLEGELSSRPGERRSFSVNYSPIYNQNGTVRAISTASIEITNQKKAEAALIQSEKLAAVGRLASSISHEINNPLEAITNLLYLISLDERLPEPLKVYVHMAQSELSRVSQIATQTLRFHRQAVAPTLVNARELVEAVVRLYTGRLANSDIRLEEAFRTETRVFCFENDIRQVLNNLIANAIDAMRTGGRLILRAHETSYPRKGVRITVADTGHGMSPATLKRIFEPFFTTKDLNGTGLGLWISAGIIDRHQGEMRVRSSENPARCGTVFTLSLPTTQATKLQRD